MRIAVLSDLHVDAKLAPSSFGLARAAFAAAAQADHVVVAGDLFDSASAMLRERAPVEGYLRSLGLWHRDRLTLVVGNHDVFETPHRGSGLARARVFARIVRGKARERHEAFAAWAGELVPAGERLGGAGELYPFERRLGHVRLWAADTTAAVTRRSGNGYWPEDGDGLLRRAAGPEPSGRRVLAIHNAPFVGAEPTLLDLARRRLAYGFPPDEHRRLERFVDDTAVEAIVCGHLHARDGSWDWELGTTPTRVHVVGRTGGVFAGSEPCVGWLEVPARGPLRWSTSTFGT